MAATAARSAMGAPAVSYVKDLDDYFAKHAIASGKLVTTSSAQPAMFAPPPAPPM